MSWPVIPGSAVKRSLACRRLALIYVKRHAAAVADVICEPGCGNSHAASLERWMARSGVPGGELRRAPQLARRLRGQFSRRGNSLRDELLASSFPCMSLFKYGNLDLLKVIQNLTIRFTPRKEFNDPFELLPDTKIVETLSDNMKLDVVRELKSQSPNLSVEEIEELFQRDYTEGIDRRKRIALSILMETANNSRILCLSKIAPCDPKALLLWGHYTKNHSGMVLEFDEAHPWVSSHDYKTGEPHNRAEVQYQAKRVGWDLSNPSLSAPADEFLYTKSDCWTYEKEVRLIRFINDKEFVPSRVDALVKFPPALLKSVTLGVNTENTTRAAVLTALGQNRDLDHVELRKAELHPDEYRLTLTVLRTPTSE